MPCNILPVFPQQLGEKKWQCGKKVKDHPRIIIWTNLVDHASPILYTKILPQSFLGSREGGFEVFLPYMDMAAILFNSAKPFDQIVSTTSREALMWNLLKVGMQFQRRRRLEIYKILYMYKG